ncbi:exodeoxyribonuclease VII small subunit [Thermotalea metallivorans]|uniref:Exodeoxyribonuclease 7 small subunit n=1 Tax=Thermotalea metallivorans TaxID=520762 RepID=A0A140L8D1_9FIRM|nr:exodeoxyribonuclease VII small subunit [Thermotalea metallivorans]KXG76806.1 Exodeoxyribonuclease 7 small subunit [Thermotalea metallivorans]
MKISENKCKEKDVSFEDAIKRLEEIVNLLDEGSLTLNETLSLYEEGIRLYKCCNEILEKTEQKITILIKGDGEKYEEVDFKDFKGE